MKEVRMVSELDGCASRDTPDSFNGAGVGKPKDGVSLDSVMDTFRAVRDGGAQTGFVTQEGRDLCAQGKADLGNQLGFSQWDVCHA